MRYTNYTNMDARFGRMYRAGDRLVKGWEGDIDGSLGTFPTLERIYARHNYDSRPDGQLCPSMSVGDVVWLEPAAVGEPEWFSVDMIGFEAVTVDPADLITDRSWLEMARAES